jgi:hypothetical protein
MAMRLVVAKNAAARPRTIVSGDGSKEITLAVKAIMTA